MNSAWRNSHEFWIFFVTLHSMSLTRASLAVSEHCGIVSIKHCLDWWSHCLFIYLGLWSLWVETFVKTIGSYSIRYLPICRKHDRLVNQRYEYLVIWWNSDAVLWDAVYDLSLEGWPHPNTNSDVVECFLILVLSCVSFLVWFYHSFLFSYSDFFRLNVFSCLELLNMNIYIWTYITWIYELHEILSSKQEISQIEIL